MIAALLLVGQALPMTPPSDWEPLPHLRLPPSATVPPQFAEFVRNEVREARCTLPKENVALELAVLVGANGRVRRIVPRAIGCPTVEQFAAGIVLRAARDAVRPPAVDTWYQTSVALPRP